MSETTWSVSMVTTVRKRSARLKASIISQKLSCTLLGERTMVSKFPYVGNFESCPYEYKVGAKHGDVNIRGVRIL